MGERREPSGRPEVVTLSPPQITSRFASLAYFPPNGESGPGFKYGFINRLPLPRFFSSFSKRAGREYPSTLVKNIALKLGNLPRLKVKQVKILPHKNSQNFTVWWSLLRYIFVSCQLTE